MTLSQNQRLPTLRGGTLKPAKATDGLLLVAPWPPEYRDARPDGWGNNKRIRKAM
jgi:hypothetical protein